MTRPSLAGVEEPPALVPMPVAWLVTHWRPGSRGDDWTWAEEYVELIERPETAAIERRVLDEGVGFMDYAAPILLGNDGRVWDGHHRIVLAMKHGIGSVMVEGSVETAPAPSVVPEAAIEALREWDVDESDVTALREAAVEAAAWKLIDRTSDTAVQGPSAETFRDALRDVSAAFPLLTTAPSTTREEVARTVADATYCAYCTGDCDDCTHAADALLARFNITQKKVR